LRAHPVTGLSRSARLLKESAVDVLAGAPEELQGLAARSMLKFDTLATVVVAWPEWLLSSGRLAGLEQLLGEAREARRIVLAWNPTALEDFLERHARRPHVVGDLPLGEDARPLPPVAAARYAVVPRARRVAVRREVPTPRPTRVAEWHHGRRRRGVGRDPLLRPSPAPSWRNSSARRTGAAAVRRSLPMLGRSPRRCRCCCCRRSTRATRAEALRAEASARLEAGGLSLSWGCCSPCSTVTIRRGRRGVTRRPPPAARPAAAPAGRRGCRRLGARVRRRGKKDRVGPKDLVGALTREVGLERDDIGKIEVRETHCLVSVTARSAERAIAGLSRVSLRGRRVTAHRDRSV
jgi:hypothetical protein